MKDRQQRIDELEKRIEELERRTKSFEEYRCKSGQNKRRYKCA